MSIQYKKYQFKKSRWKTRYDLMDDISTGNLDIYLVRPMNYLLYKYFSSLHIFFLFLLGMLVFGAVNGINLFSLQSLNIICFYIISISFVFIIFAMIGTLSFLVENVLTFRDNAWNIIRLFGGSIIPLNFHPPTLSHLLKFLPFEYIYYKPTVFTQGILLPTTQDYLITITWFLVGIFILRIMWNKSLKLYSSQGG